MILEHAPGAKPLVCVGLYDFGGLIFGGAYTWRGLFSEFYSILHKNAEYKVRFSIQERKKERENSYFFSSSTGKRFTN